MIRPVDNAAGDAGTAKPKAAAADAQTSFADVHAAALARTAPVGSLGPPKPPAPFETWAPVEGHPHYVRITSGARAGLYLNLVLGPRHGQTFQMERRDGKAVHVYGSGTGEVVVAAAEDHGGTAPADGAHARSAHAERPPRGERWAAVAGHYDYADILDGPRDGLYVNTSGGTRDGMAFQIVVRNGHEFHVYGSGKHRLVVPIRSAKASSHRTVRHAGGGALTGGVGAPR